MTTSNSLLERCLISLSWPEAVKRRQHNKVNLAKFSLFSQILHSFSYSEHKLIIAPKPLTPLDLELEKIGIKLGRLWDTAQVAMRQNRLDASINALLKIIAIDNYNAAAYNRLGIIYAKRKRYDVSIEYFRTAVRFEPSAASCHNLGLIYYETGDYKSALKYFKKSLKYDDHLAARYIAIAKTYEQLGNIKQVFKNLEIAAKLEPGKQTSTLLFKAYKQHGMDKKALAVEKQLISTQKVVIKTMQEPKIESSHDNKHVSIDANLLYQY